MTYCFIDKRLNQKQSVRTKLSREFIEVCIQSPDNIPPPLMNVDPVKWTLKEGHTAPVRCRCSKPNWGTTQEVFLRVWTERVLKTDLIVIVKRSERASRLLVPKYRVDTPKGAIPTG